MDIPDTYDIYIFWNVNEKVHPALRELLIASRGYQKAQQELDKAHNVFVDCLAKIERMAKTSSGPSKEIGDAIGGIVDYYKESEKSKQQLSKAFYGEYILPLETTLEAQIHNITKINKVFSSNFKAKCDGLDKARGELKKVKRKSQGKKGITGKYEEKVNDCEAEYNKKQNELEAYTVLEFERALNEERKRYCMVLDYTCEALSRESTNYAKNHNFLKDRIPAWRALFRDEASMAQQKQSIDSLDSNDMLLRSHSLVHALTQRKEVTDLAQNSQTLVALYDLDADTQDKLALHEGDNIKTLGQPANGWQYGTNTNTGRSGWFPLTYTGRESPSNRTKRGGSLAEVGQTIDYASHRRQSSSRIEQVGPATISPIGTTPFQYDISSPSTSPVIYTN
ncbi:uncharacterized protein TRIADDRAFT_53684 [Trichoplax adhaerens]|uniref:SH3 domain-containing protein n=1 Tax=Trichoplax adhaerens TaxID=10228 RepID=B3RPW2_TRIAD|nr:hypothetical protein TRIADDRAFT_53684 [Trichoplax adhaerens]EDV27712.1 hypothetical protein TRIADDRAFT_53684 [Trichoplax adhaerens]|eukprot:XP_002109546.1 hypothetical protein TRIADDRAFT_53684 [Trichoplax adhaerens]